VILEELKSILQYDPATGIFTWKETRSPTCKKGQVAGQTTKNGYVVIGVLGGRYRAHHLAWFYIHGVLPKEIDHKNRIRNDNRIENLRIASRSENNVNSKRHSKITNVRGVMRNKKKFTAYIDKDGKRTYLGTYSTVEEAQTVRDMKAKEMYGEFEETRRTQ
jgi:phosphotransferase system IIB component